MWLSNIYVCTPPLLGNFSLLWRQYLYIMTYSDDVISIYQAVMGLFKIGTNFCSQDIHKCLSSFSQGNLNLIYAGESPQKYVLWRHYGCVGDDVMWISNKADECLLLILFFCILLFLLLLLLYFVFLSDVVNYNKMIHVVTHYNACACIW